MLETLKRREAWVAMGLAAAITALAFVGASSAQRPLAEGLQPYAPTRIEWLALELNAMARDELATDHPWSTAFARAADPNTITVWVRYQPWADRELINKAVDNAKRLARGYADGHGWSWVRVAEDVKMYPKVPARPQSP